MSYTEYFKTFGEALSYAEKVQNLPDLDCVQLESYDPDTGETVLLIVTEATKEMLIKNHKEFFVW